jgi:hypothetical protein
MPQIWGDWHKVQWAYDMSDASEAGGWVDFTQEESNELELAWTDEQEIVLLPNHARDICILPLQHGGQAWCKGWRPFRMIALTNSWMYMRRFVVLA